tara:strand:- start:120 stop:503 length:384 start_codon:yes stop_codon:yes gene_type:complete
MSDKKYILTEAQIKSLVSEQGLYGNSGDVVDYDLPEYLSDVIILTDLKDFTDVRKSVKELHKRLMRLEKGLDSGGQHQKAYKTGGNYTDKKRKFQDYEKKEESLERDAEMQKELDQLKSLFTNKERK